MRLFIIAMAIFYWAGSSLLAKSITIAPNDCPAPADIAAIGLQGADAGDLNPWRHAADIDPIIEIELQERTPTRRVFHRVWADGETGETILPARRLCGE